MRLRKLKQKDAEKMFMWMHDDDVVHYMQTDFKSKTIKDCRDFIEAAQDMSLNMHLAIVDEDDNYMGTVSLKHINSESAEFAIAISKSAMGKEFSRYATEEIIRIGLQDLKLSRVYWNVLKENKRAVRFYDKNGYQRITENSDKIFPTGTLQDISDSLYWYLVEK